MLENNLVFIPNRIKIFLIVLSTHHMPIYNDNMLHQFPYYDYYNANKVEIDLIIKWDFELSLSLLNAKVLLFYKI